MVTGAERSLAPGHGRRQMPQKIGFRHVSAVAEHIDVHFIAQSGNTLKAVMVFLPATRGGACHHMAQSGKILLESAHKLGGGFIFFRSNEHGDKTGIILGQKAAQRAFHTRIAPGHRHNHTHRWPFVFRYGAVGLGFFLNTAGHAFAPAGQNIQQSALGGGQQKPYPEHRHSFMLSLDGSAIGSKDMNPLQRLL